MISQKQIWLWLLIGINCAFQPSVYGVSVNEPVPFDKGQHYSFVWIVWAFLGSIGTVHNGILIWLMFSLDKSKRVQFFNFNLAMNINDFALSVERVIFSSVYLNHRGIYQGLLCTIEAMLNLAPVLLAIQLIAGMSYVARYDLCNNAKLTTKDINASIVGMCILTLIGVFITQFIPPPYGGNRLDYSGSFCFINWSAYISTPLLYGIYVISPLSYTAYNVYITYITISQAQKLLAAVGIKEQARGQYVSMVYKLLSFVVAIFACYLLSIVSTLYQLIYRQYFPGNAQAVVVILGYCVNTIVNPTLFYYLNVDLREKFWEKIGIRLTFLLYSLGINCFKSNRKGLYYKANKNNIHPSMSTISVSMYNYDDLEFWLSEAELRKVLEEHCRREYVMENILFVDHARRYVDTANQLVCKSGQPEQEERGFEELSKNIVQTKNTSGEACLENGMDKSSPEEAWKALEQQAKLIYTLFIVPTKAPLEINIPSNMRNKVLSVLLQRDISDLNQSRKSNNLSSKTSKEEDIKFPEYSSIADVNEYIHAFDECLECVLNILRTDIWPRFRKSSNFEKGKTNHGLGNPNAKV